MLSASGMKRAEAIRMMICEMIEIPSTKSISQKLMLSPLKSSVMPKFTNIAMIQNTQ